MGLVSREVFLKDNVRISYSVHAVIISWLIESHKMQKCISEGLNLLR